MKDQCDGRITAGVHTLYCMLPDGHDGNCRVDLHSAEAVVRELQDEILRVMNERNAEVKLRQAAEARK